MQEADEISSALETLSCSGPVEILEDGQLLAELSGVRYEVRRAGKHVLLHLWSEERNLVRRILRMVPEPDGQLLLEVQRFGRNRPGKLQFVPVGQPRAGGRLGREGFRSRFRRMLAEQFPDDEVESLTTAADLEHSFSGAYTRGLVRRGQRNWAVMGVSSAETGATVDAILSFGLLWLDWNRQHARRSTVAGLRLFLPFGAARVTAHRLQAILPSANVELYELDEAEHRAQRVDVQDVGNLATWLTPRREVEQTLAAARGIVDKIRALAPDAIDAVVPPGTREVALRFRGLEFARWHSGRLDYGPPEERRRLTGEQWAKLEELVGQLASHRHPAAADTNHALYRAQAERWLETLALADPARLDAGLDPQHLYSQVPAFSAGDRGVLDLLGVTRDGRLTVIELKVTEDIHLVLQAVDYWLRVRWHQREGDFPRYGYFSGVQLQNRWPRLLLVAPGFRFHSATDVLLRYLLEGIEVTRIGLNEGWRKGLQVVFRN